MKQCVKISETCTLRSQIPQAQILDRPLVVDVLKDNNQSAVEIVRLGTRRCTLCFFPFTHFRFRDLWLRSRKLWLRSSALWCGQNHTIRQQTQSSQGVSQEIPA